MLQAALAHHQAGRLREAESLYRALLETDPENCDALHLLGVAAHQQGRHEEAAALIEKAAAAAPSRPDIHNNLGEVQRALGRMAEAERSYRAALALDPGSAAAQGNLGNALLAQGRMEEAAQRFGRAADMDPDNADLRNNLAVALHALGRTRESEQSRRDALALRPDFVEARVGLAIALVELGRPAEAEQACRRALALKPDSAEAHHVLSNALRKLGRLDEAAREGRDAVALNPDYAEAHNHLAVALAGLERFEEAAQSYRRALALKPDYAEAHANLGQLCLLRGDYASGWKEYAWRRKHEAATPLWTGSEELRGKTILLKFEQGLGDTLHFVRYAPLVAAKGAKVFLQVPAVLAPFMRDLGEVIAEGAPAPRTDFWCPLLSLPAALRTTVQDIPAAIPYLRADPGDWRARLGGGKQPLVGLCWRGNPNYAGDRTRSMSLKQLEPLLQLPGIRFISLQKELQADEQAPNLIHPGADFAGTASLVAALDLVVSVDTVWAHWAGAIGKPLWLLLARIPHWCWMMEREDSPWYPSARLFRQLRAGEWDAVVEKLARELGRRF